MFKEWKQFGLLLLALGVVMMSGVFGFMILEGWSFLDAVYMTIITVSTVGFREVAPLSPQGKWFTVLLIIGGWGTVLYSFSRITHFIVQGEIKNLFENRRMEKMIAKMTRHFIICGYGRVGEKITEDMRKRKIPFIVVEKDPEICRGLLDRGLPAIDGDASEEATLAKANIRSARGLAATATTDAENVYIVMTAREMSSALYIVARASQEEAEKKLVRAGANRVISPLTIGGRQIALSLLQPAVVDFFELASDRENMEIAIEQMLICPKCTYAGKPLTKVVIFDEMDVMVVAVQKSDGSMCFNPSALTILEPGDTVITMGNANNIKKLQQLFYGEECEHAR